MRKIEEGKEIYDKIKVPEEMKKKTEDQINSFIKAPTSRKKRIPYFNMEQPQLLSWFCALRQS